MERPTPNINDLSLAKVTSPNTRRVRVLPLSDILNVANGIAQEPSCLNGFLSPDARVWLHFLKEAEQAFEDE
jgi:hypothetical protein